jgi:hypothetical protein
MPYFTVCPSPKKLYIKEVKQFMLTAEYIQKLFAEHDIEHLPQPVQKYFRYCGFIGQPKSDCAQIVWDQSHIRMRPNQKMMRLKTYQHNFVSEPSRLAYMRANMLGVIPFEGRDKYHNGQGHMLGTLARMIKIFDQKDLEIAQGGAIVLLAESLLLPLYAIQPYIHWEPIDEFTAKARFIHKDVDVGGTFHFNALGEYIRFTTNERPYSLPGGGYELTPYTIQIRSYQQQGDIRIAKEVAAIWNLPQGDYEYWKGTVKEIRFQ